MTKDFEEYVEKRLAHYGIKKGDEFETSIENLGVLKWNSGIMYKVSGRELCTSDILYILEDSLLERVVTYEVLTKIDALKKLTNGNKQIYTRFADGLFGDSTLRRVELNIEGDTLTTYVSNSTDEVYSELKLIDILDLDFWLAN